MKQKLLQLFFLILTMTAGIQFATAETTGYTEDFSTMSQETDPAGWDYYLKSITYPDGWSTFSLGSSCNIWVGNYDPYASGKSWNGDSSPTMTENISYLGGSGKDQSITTPFMVVSPKVKGTVTFWVRYPNESAAKEAYLQLYKLTKDAEGNFVAGDTIAIKDMLPDTESISYSKVTVNLDEACYLGFADCFVAVSDFYADYKYDDDEDTGGGTSGEVKTTTVTICEGIGFMNNFPFYFSSPNSKSEIIYSSNRMKDVEAGYFIQKMSLKYWQWNSNNLEHEVTVWMANCDDQSELTDFTDVSSMTQVYHSSKFVVSRTGDDYGWLDIPLDSPFKYEGKALRIVVQSASTDLEGGMGVYFAGAPREDGDLAITKYGDSDFESISPSAYTQYFPSTRFDISAEEGSKTDPVETEKVVICASDGWEFLQNYPIDLSKQYSKSETVYTTSRMTPVTAGYKLHQLSLEYWNYGSEASSSVNIWLANGDDPSDMTDFTDVSTMTQVCSNTPITVAYTGDNKKVLDIPFDTPFEYTGKALYMVIESTASSTSNVYFQGCARADGDLCLIKSAADADSYASATPSLQTQYFLATSFMVEKCETPEPELRSIVVTIPAVSNQTYGYTTFYNLAYAVSLPEGVTANTYKFSSDGECLEAFAVEDIVPASCGVVLYTETPGDYTLTESISSPEGFPSNDLSGSDEEAMTEGDDGAVFYQFEDRAEGVGFYYGAEGGVAFLNPAHKAYLVLDGAIGSKYTGFTLDGTTFTGISEVPNNGSNKAKGIYTLSGQKLKEMTKSGIYVVDGKKVIKR